MGWQGTVIQAALLVAIVAFLPGLPPRTTFPIKAFSVTPPRDLEGVLAPNGLLNNAERLLENQLKAPETLLVRGNITYVSVLGGHILEVTNGDQVRVVTKFGRECRGGFDERECGRPVGMAFDTQGNNLIVCEVYSGLWQVNIKTGAKKQLFSLDQDIEGGTITRRAMIPNSLAVARNGDIYWSDMFADFILYNPILTAFQNPSGRLLHFSRATGKNRVLIDEIFGANGVALNKDESVVLVGDFSGQAIRRHYLKGPKAGTDDIFIDGLPGLVDNLSGDEHGIWAALVITADKANPSPFALLASYPHVRQFCLRFLSALVYPFEFLYLKTGSTLALRVNYFIGDQENILGLLPKRGTVLRLDWEGEIVAALHGGDGTARMISNAVVSGEHLLLGSPLNPWIGRVRLSEEMLQLVSGRKPSKQQKPSVDTKKGVPKEEL